MLLQKLVDISLGKRSTSTNPGIRSHGVSRLRSGKIVSIYPGENVVLQSNFDLHKMSMSAKAADDQKLGNVDEVANMESSPI